MKKVKAYLWLDSGISSGQLEDIQVTVQLLFRHIELDMCCHHVLKLLQHVEVDWAAKTSSRIDFTSVSCRDNNLCV